MISNSRPLLLLVATLMILIIAMAGFWLAFLPRHTFQNLRQQAQAEGVVLEAASYDLSLSDGPALSLENITMTASDPAQKGLVTAKSMRIGLGAAHLFGIGNSVGPITLDSPVIDLNLKSLHLPADIAASYIEVTDAIIKLRDPDHRATLSIREVNGTWTSGSNGRGQLQASGLLNDVLTAVTIDVDETARLGNSGSPADLSLTTKSVNVAFSGRIKAKDSLQLDGQVAIAAADVRDIAQLMGASLKSLSDEQALQIEAGVSTQGGEAVFNLNSAQVGSSAMTGKVTLAAGADRAKFSGAVAIDKLVLLARPAAPLTLPSPGANSPCPLPIC